MNETNNSTLSHWCKSHINIDYRLKAVLHIDLQHFHNVNYCVSININFYFPRYVLYVHTFMVILPNLKLHIKTFVLRCCDWGCVGHKKLPTKKESMKHIIFILFYCVFSLFKNIIFFSIFFLIHISLCLWTHFD